jgi:hypothetical protein
VLPAEPAQAALFDPVLRVGFAAVAWPRYEDALEATP